jgi:hypothetical protein
MRMRAQRVCHARHRPGSPGGVLVPFAAVIVLPVVMRAVVMRAMARGVRMRVAHTLEAAS